TLSPSLESRIRRKRARGPRAQPRQAFVDESWAAHPTPVQPRTFLGDKGIGLTSRDLQKRSLWGIQNVLCSPRCAQRKKAMGAVDPSPVTLVRWRRRPRLAHPSPEERGERDDRDDDHDHAGDNQD